MIRVLEEEGQAVRARSFAHAVPWDATARLYLYNPRRAPLDFTIPFFFGGLTTRDIEDAEKVG